MKKFFAILLLGVMTVGCTKEEDCTNGILCVDGAVYQSADRSVCDNHGGVEIHKCYEELID